ncbi:MAG: hypothetical protein HOP19_26335, partial [Acidobacteria bacterium]|nr:hypothetical protein [Acidobacteriota bacterium]
MIRAYLKDSLHWLHLFCFKLHTFKREAERLSRGQAGVVFLKVYPWLWLSGWLVLCGIGLTSEFAGYDFHWQRTFMEFAE